MPIQAKKKKEGAREREREKRAITTQSYVLF
jgi:hypothetical protein